MLSVSSLSHSNKCGCSKMIEGDIGMLCGFCEMRDFWEVMVHDFTEHLGPKLLNDPFNSDELCNATGPLVVPATSCPGEPVPTDWHFIRPVNVKKSFASRPLSNHPKTTSYMQYAI